MDCETLKREFDPVAEPTDTIRSHVQGCRSCQQYVKELNQLRSLLVADPPVPVPHDFNLRLQQRLERVQRNPLTWWRWADIRYALPVAAMMLVGVTTLALLNQHQKPIVVNQPPPVAIMSNPTSPSPEPNPSRNPGDVRLTTSEVFPAPPLLMNVAGETVRQRRLNVNAADHVFLDGPQVFLRLRDDSREREKLLAIPSVVVGAEPLFVSAQSTPGELDHVY
jgi:hypothetical protein